MAAPRKDNVREKLLDSAEKLLAERPLADISLAEIARAAGVSKGTLYYHYKTKNEIIFDITDRYLDQQWNDLVRWTEDSNKDTSLHRLVKYVLERDSTAAELRMQLIYDAMLGNEPIRARLNERYTEFARLLTEKIAERGGEQPAEFLAWLTLLCGEGLNIQRMLGGLDAGRFTEQAEKFIKSME